MPTLSPAAASRIAIRLLPEEGPEFQLAPMINILLVLLVFFVAIGTAETFLTPEGLVLPNAPSAGWDHFSGGGTIVEVHSSALKRSAPIILNGKAYAKAEQLRPLLQGRFDANPKARILVLADKNVRYATLKQVLDAAKDAGFRGVTFSVVDRTP